MGWYIPRAEYKEEHIPPPPGGGHGIFVNVSGDVVTIEAKECATISLYRIPDLVKILIDLYNDHPDCTDSVILSVE